MSVTPDSPVYRKRPFAIGATAAALLLLVMTVVPYVGVQTRAQFREIEASWLDYAGAADRKGALISALRGQLGYGGIIHNFKNFVLRQDPIYLDAVEAQVNAFRKVLTDYRAEPTSPEERQALDTIAHTISLYESKLPIAVRAAREGWDAARTDALVRVDDAGAIAALATLETIWQSNRARSTERIAAAVAQGERLISIGFVAIAAVVAAAIVLGLLVRLLMRDMARAFRRIARELTERRRLERSEGRLAEAVEQSPATIMITDTAGRIQYVNRRFEQVTGWPRNEVVGQTPKFLQSGNTPPETYREIRRVLGEGKSWHGVLQNRRRDGSTYWVESTLLPLLDPDGRAQNYIGIGEDVTEKREAREQVVRAQKLEAVGLLAGGVAHDFNNILTTIVGSAHLVAMELEEGSEAAQDVEQIQVAARRAQSLVQELLSFARREPGRPRPTELTGLMEEVARLVRASLLPDTTLDCCKHVAPLYVNADPNHLHQILMNLCRNASEAIGVHPGRIGLAAEEIGAPEDLPSKPFGWVRISVTDDGIGMSEETRRRIFDPFFTTKPIGKGSGLGLAVVSGLVEDMGGRIAVESAPGEGTTFSIYLPAAPAVATAEDQERAALPRGHERLMVVDDEPEIAGTFRRLLLRLGYQVEAFTSPKVALENFRRDPGRYDLVISDIVMPGMTGDDLARACRELRPTIPVILCSGYGPRDVELDGPHPARLDKPVDPSALAQEVRRMIDAQPA